MKHGSFSKYKKKITNIQYKIDVGYKFEEIKLRGYFFKKIYGG